MSSIACISSQNECITNTTNTLEVLKGVLRIGILTIGIITNPIYVLSSGASIARLTTVCFFLFLAAQILISLVGIFEEEERGGNCCCCKAIFHFLSFVCGIVLIDICDVNPVVMLFLAGIGCAAIFFFSACNNVVKLLSDIYDKDISTIPLVFQYNKRDLGEKDIPLLSIETLEKDLNSRLKAPFFEASALTGANIIPTMKKIISSTILSLRKELE